MAVAFSPLAFPTIITPYGIAAIIILVALAPDTQSEAGVLGLALLVLIVDWLVMLFADIVAGWLAPVLLLVGVVLSVTQVALGLTAILHSLHSMAVITLHLP
jgi:multiple antibiotic resistance protein